MTRRRFVSELEAGGIPHAFGYADRARELELSGATPHSYRHAKEAIGAKVFEWGDVSQS